MTRHLWCLGIFIWSVGASAQAPKNAPEESPEDAALDRYQACFQKMVEANITDNAFMRKCLGLVDKPARRAQGGDLNLLTKDDAEPAIKNQLTPVKECYGKLLVQTKDLGLTPTGNIEAKLSVNPDGTVAAVVFEPGTLTDVAFLSCVKDRLKAWKLPKSTVTEAVSMAVELRLGATDDRAPLVALAKHSPKFSGPGYDLSQDEILNVFRKNMPTLRRCYDAQLKRLPKAQGQVSADLTVSAKGRVTRVDFRDLNWGDEAFKGCLMAELSKWRYPKPRTAESVTVHYPPFAFTPR